MEHLMESPLLQTACSVTDLITFNDTAKIVSCNGLAKCDVDTRQEDEEQSWRTLLILNI